MKLRWIVPVLVVCIFALGQASLTRAQSTAFLYQGNLKASSTPANGNYDFEFKLFDAVSGGSQIGSTFTALNVVMINGVFATTIDFGNQFPGPNRFIEIGVRLAGGGAYQQLLPRQQIASVPYGIRSLSAANADNAATSQNALSLGGVAASQYVVTTDPRLSDERNPLPGSSSYIQNTTSTQASSNFNVSGTGAANAFDADSDYRINGFRVLATPGTGLSNIFVGYRAGNLSLTGTHNSAVGYLSGENLTSGYDNSVFGKSSGAALTTGYWNTFSGSSSGASTTTGNHNSFFGADAGKTNLTGSHNAFFGFQAGLNNGGSENSFFGTYAGEFHGKGSGNTFVGRYSGVNSSTGNYNIAIGYNSGFTADGFSFATAIGTDAMATSSNQITLGRGNGADTVRIPGSANISGSLTVDGTLNATLPITDSYVQNTTNQQAASNFNISGNGVVGGTLTAGVVNSGTEFKLNGLRFIRGSNANTIVGVDAGFNNTAANNSFLGAASGYANTSGDNNSFVGFGAGYNNSVGLSNTFVGSGAGMQNIAGSYNVALGRNAGTSNTSANGNTYIGANANGNAGIVNSTAIGYNAFVEQTGSLVLGAIAGVNGAFTSTNVGIGTTAPSAPLHVAGTIYSSSGGFKFPDGSIQSTAAGTNTTYTAYRTDIGTFSGGGSFVPVLQLDLPAGTYSLMFDMHAYTDIAIGRRDCECQIANEFHPFGLWLTPENNIGTLSFHSVVTLASPQSVTVSCIGSSGTSDSHYQKRRLTAIKLGDVIIQ